MLRSPNAATVGVLITCFTLTWMMLDGFRKDLKGDVAAVEVRLDGRIAAVEARLEERITGVEGNMAAMEVRLKREIAAVESRLSADIRETEARLDGRLTRVENRLDRIMEILPGGRDASDPQGGIIEGWLVPRPKPTGDHS